MELLEDRQLLAAFTPGNLVAYRVGDGVGAFPGSNVAVPVFLDEIKSTDGSLVQSIKLPNIQVGNQRALTASAIGTTEGLLTRSGDGRYLLLTGYNAPAGTPGLTNSASSTTNRVVARVDALGIIDTSTVISDGYDGVTIRGAVSPDGLSIWTSGGGTSNSSGGVRFLSFGGTGPSTQISTSSTDTRGIDIFGGQLFVSANPTPTPVIRVGTVGASLPATSGQTISNLPGPIASNLIQPFQFFLADLNPNVPGPDVMYVADQATNGGVRKFSLSGGTWNYNGNVVLAGSGVRGMTGSVTNGIVTVFATSTETTQNTIWKVVDGSGWNQTLTQLGAQVFSTGIANEAYRGLAFVPELPQQVARDFGDAPDSYHTLLASNGPFHNATGPTLGASRDAESDGLPSSAADGDDLIVTDDEDGVTFLTPLLTSAGASHAASLLVSASADARLDAWIDFNRNGMFDDQAERITLAGGTPVTGGDNLLPLTIPAGATVGSTYARVRLSTAGGLLPAGSASDGEVEDYAVSIVGDSGVDVAINLPAGGGSYAVDTSGGQVRLRQGNIVLFATSVNSIKSLAVIGTGDTEFFEVAPALAGGPTIRIDGGPPPEGPESLPMGDTVGDKLKLDMSATTGPVVVSTVGGSATSASHQPVNFVGIEDIDLIDNNLLTSVQMGDLYVRGTEGNDTIQFGSGWANLSRTRINNYIVNLAVTTKTIAYGRGGNDYLQQTNLAKPGEFYGEGGDDYLSGYTGNDLLVGGPGIDRLMGGDGDNELWGDNLGEQDLAAGGNDILSGGSGVDKVYGGGGNDQVSTLGGNDYVYGGAGDDSIDGGDGNDRLYGGDGNDTIGGSTGNDLLAGNAGDDKLYGKDGNDVLIGGTGADLVMGENGNDLLFDGTVTYDDPNTAPPIGNDTSHAFNDASDVAMTALLADWSTDSAIAAAFLASTHDSFLDSLSGGGGLDTVSADSSPTDTGDWESLI